MASHPIYQFHAELLDYKPRIWRQFQVQGNITMARLGYILMSMFEMKASHLFCFDVPMEENFRRHMRGKCTDEEYNKLFSHDRVEPIKNMRFEIISEDSYDYHNPDKSSLHDATDIKISRLTSSEGFTMTFNYDYGDDWCIGLNIEKVIIDKDLPGKELPRVLKGEGYGIIEDCGGVHGLAEIAKAFKKKKGTQYREYCEWLGCNDLDLAAFDIEDANLRVKKIPRIYTDIYEFGISPTQRSVDFLERKYMQTKKKTTKHKGATEDNFFPEYDRKALDQVFQNYFDEMLARVKAREETEGGERKVRIATNDNENVAVILYDIPMLGTADYIADFAETTLRAYGCRHMAIKKEMLTEEFYDLPPSELAKLIRKLSDSIIRLAVIGDFSMYEGRSLYGALVDGGISGFFFGAADEREALNMLRDGSCGET